MRVSVRRLLACLACVAFANLAGAQQTEPSPFEIPVPDGAPAILTVDIDRLFVQSQFGERIARDYNEAREALATENRRIADALRTEELALAQQRADMDVELFRAEAAAFDEKAQGIRRAQDAKENALEDTLIEGRALFLEVTRPILGQLMVERGAFAILDRRSVLLSLGSIDITDDAVIRIDDTIGDGTEP